MGGVDDRWDIKKDEGRGGGVGGVDDITKVGGGGGE